MPLPEDLLNMTVYPAGASAVVAALCDVLRIPEIIDAVVPWDPAQCRLSPGLRVKAMLINILVHRTALWRVERFYEHQDIQVLFGNHQVIEPGDLNDDALARALDKLAAVDLNLLFSSIALQAALTHDVPLSQLHCDTTSISVQGAYEEEGDLLITFGHSKDMRPDLKQFLVGLTVTKDGLPLLAQLLDGNKSDKTWYPEVLDQLAARLGEEELRKTIFVADAAFPTRENLERVAAKGLCFISRLPEVFGLAEELKDLAWEQKEWTVAGALSAKPNAASYRTQSFWREVHGKRYRLIVVHSSSLEKRKEKSLEKRWQREREVLEDEVKELLKRPFACAADAQKAIDLFLKEHQRSAYRLTGTVEEETVTKRTRRGRPKADDPVETEVTYRARIAVGETIPEVMEDMKNRASTFVLITNLLDPAVHPDAEVLREYKEQNSVEEQFRFLKSPFLLGPVFVKKNDRLRALGFVLELALLMAAYLRYRVKKALEKEGRPLVTPQKQKLDHPTVRVILDMLAEIMVIRAGHDRAIINRPGPEILRLIRLAGFHEGIYLAPFTETG